MKRLRQIVAHYGDVLGTGLIALVGVYFFFEAGEIARIQPQGNLGPDFWPRVILGCLIAFSLLKGSLALIKAKVKENPRDGVAKESWEAGSGKGDGWRLGAGILLLIAYAYFTELIGFPLANLLFLFTFMYLGGVRRWLWLFLLPTLCTVGLLYVFVKVVYVPLPRGSGIFGDLTIALYTLLRIF